MVDLCPDSLSNSVLLQLMRVNQTQSSLLVSTLMANQQRVISALLQQHPLPPNSVMEAGLYNRNYLGFHAQSLPNNALPLSNTNFVQPATAFNVQQISTGLPTSMSLSKSIQSTSSPTLVSQKSALEESIERKRLIRAKLLSGRPRSNTTPATSNLIRKMRPKTQSFHSPQKAIFRHHPANLPVRNPDACALEEFATVYLLNSLDCNKLTGNKPTVYDVNQILDDVLETSQL